MAEKSNGGEMTFLEHLEELRAVVLKALAVFILALVGVLIGFSYFNSIMLYPLNSAKEKLASWNATEEIKPIEQQRMGPVFLVTTDANGIDEKKDGPFYIVPKDNSIELFKDSANAPTWYDGIKLRSMSFATPIVVYFYVGFLGALGISLPALFYFAARFIAPGLTKEEVKMMRPAMIAAVLLFCIGVSFAFYFILPMGIAFMSWLSQGMQLEMFPDAQSYYSMVIFVTIAIGVTFELPLLEVILIYLGVLNVSWLKKNRRMVFLVILIFATVVTPPDAITQISLTIPLYLMYEIALVIGDKMRKRKLRKEARAEKLAELQEEKERQEYAQMVAKERLAAEDAEKQEEIDEAELAKIEIDKSNYHQDFDTYHRESEPLPDDYDPNNIESTPDDYGYASYDEIPDGEYEAYKLDSYIDYGNLSKPVPNFSPNWNLNNPDTSFFSPNWNLNQDDKPKDSSETLTQKSVSDKQDFLDDSNIQPNLDDKNDNLKNESTEENPIK